MGTEVGGGGILYNDCVEGQGGTDAVCAKYRRIKANHSAVAAGPQSAIKEPGHRDTGTLVFGFRAGSVGRRAVCTQFTISNSDKI